MGDRFVISAEELERVRVGLVQAPPLEAKMFTKFQAIKRLRPELEALQSRGYNLEDAARYLRQLGIPISANVLRSYWSETKRAREGSAKHPRRTAGRAAGDRAPASRAQSATRTQTPREASRSSAAGAPSVPAPLPRSEVEEPARSGGEPKPSVAGAPVPNPAPGGRRSQFTVKEDSDKL